MTVPMRLRILDAARELFAERGYAGASMSQLAGRLGTTKAALYYHFRSKADIVEALLAQPLSTYAELVDQAAGRSPEDLLGAIVDTTADLHTLNDLMGSDPSVRTLLRDRALPRSLQINDRLTDALAGPDPDPARLVLAHAAYAVVKNGTLALMSATGARPTPAERAELVAAALRVLTP